MAAWTFPAIGTVWEIVTATELSEQDRAAVNEVIDHFDQEWSRFREDSVVTLLGKRGGSVAAPADTVPMLDAYRVLSRATDGSVNPLVGRSLSALGYGAGYPLKAGDPVAAPQDWEDTLRWSPRELTLSTPAEIDVGALGKGRLVDLVCAALAHIPGSVVVDAGGDLSVRGEPVRVALEHPYDAQRAVGVVTVNDGALCASATNRRAWGDGLHHVLDAHTGQPVRTWAATWAFAADAMTADAVATALFFDGGPMLAASWGVEWVRMATSGRVEYSPHSPAELFTRKGRS